MAYTGILGGTFNPIHNGHLAMARIARSELRLDRLLLVPTGIPPHKLTATSSEHRLNMTRIAAQTLDDCEVSDIELVRAGKSFTYLTLTELRALYPGDRLVFIMGADMMCSFTNWKNPDIIAQLATLAVVPRPGEPDDFLKSCIDSVRHDLPHADIALLSESGPDISSTQIREMVARGEDISALVPAAVAEYIYANKLYIKDGKR